MKTLLATAFAAAILLATGAACAADAQIISAGQGAEGAAWAPILFAIVVFGFVMRALSQLGSDDMEGGDEPGLPALAGDVAGEGEDLAGGPAGHRHSRS